MRYPFAKLAVVCATVAAASGLYYGTSVSCACTPHVYPPSATALPTVSGTPQVGQTLTCNQGTWTQNGTGFGLAHQWQSSANSGASWSNLTGFVGTTYIPNGGDSGNLLRCQETGSNVNGSTIVQTAAAGPIVNGGGGLTTANVFMSSAGTTTCTRGSSATAYSAALAANHVCTTATKAYAISNGGDTVLVEAGSYNAQSIAYIAKSFSGGCTLYPAGGADVSGCITFTPDGGGAPLGTNVNYASFYSAAPDVRIKNIAINSNLQVKWNSSLTGRLCTASIPQPHDIVFDGVKAGTTATGGLSITSVYNVSFVNGDMTAGTDNASSADWAAYPFQSSPPFTNDCNATAHPGLTAAALVDHGIYFHGNRVHDLLQLTAGLHLGCTHVRFVNDYEISDNQYLNCAQYGVNVESQGVGSAYRAEDNGLIKDNVFDKSCSNQVTTANGGKCSPLVPLVIICNITGDTITNTTVAYNTIYGTTATIFHTSPCSGAATFAGDVFVGNTVSSANSSGNCVSSLGFSYAYNTYEAGVTCGGTGEQVGVPTYVSPAPTVWNFTPASGSPAIGLVPTSITVGGVTVGCSAVDVYGNARPGSGQTNCASGAAER